MERPKAIVQKHYAHEVAKNLASRHRETNEVKDIMTGERFRQVEPKYTSKPDLKKTEIHHQVLCHDKNRFHDLQKEYGKKQNLRDQDPPMKQILGWGEFDDPVKNDFTTNKGAFFEQFKINKMGVEYISEKQDNFRNPSDKLFGTKEEDIIRYLKEENQRLIKEKIHRNLEDKDQMTRFTTEYREQSKKNDVGHSDTARKLHEFFYKDVTVAGEAKYLKDSNKRKQPIVAPETLKQEMLESKITQKAWRDCQINPQLVRVDEPTLSERQEAYDAKKNNANQIAHQQTSASPTTKIMSAEAQKILEQQEKELNDEQKQELREKLKNLKLCSRWLPDSSLTTFFGKPAFHAYGNGNTDPTYGGSIYGQYMKTHNINPHSGGNKPEFSQVHDRALLGGTIQIRAPGSRSPKKVPIPMVRKPIPPRQAKSKKQVPSDQMKKDMKKRLPIKPQTFREIQAQELEILPPSFSEKHLQTKKVQEVRQVFLGKQKKQQQLEEDKLKLSQIEESKKLQRKETDGEKTHPKFTAQNSAGSSEGATASGSRDGGDSDQRRSSGRYASSRNLPSSSHRSMKADSESYRQREKLIAESQSGKAREINCPVHGTQRQVEAQMLNDPRNYKFLPSQVCKSQILVAGKQTAQSEAVKDLLSWGDD